MKKKQAMYFLICTIALLLNSIIPIFAIDGFDMVNNMNMDMILEQSYHTIDSVEFATDHAMDNNMLNHQINDMMFFPDLLDVFNTNTPNSANDNLSNNDIIVAVDNGAWMPEFNNFFNNPTAEIPIDIEMMNVDMDSVMAPAFQPMSQQNTIGDLNNNPDMNPFNNDPTFNNSAELEFSSAPDAITNLEWNMETNPEKALLDVAQPENNTDMLDATGGEILDADLSNEPIGNNQNIDNDTKNESPILESPIEFAPPAE